MKHIDIKNHFTRNATYNKSIRLFKIGNKFNPTYALINVISLNKFSIPCATMQVLYDYHK